LTAPLHHVNQLYLHLPALGGFMAGQAAAGEEIQRMARLAEARSLHREAVEVVAAAKDTVAIEPIRPEPDPGLWDRGRRRRGRGARQDGPGPDGAPEASPRLGFDLAIVPVVDERV
jgi:hypothetical protein